MSVIMALRVKNNQVTMGSLGNNINIEGKNNLHVSYSDCV